MGLPETVAVRYTEEEAECLSVRPLVRQTFELRELMDMVVSVTGKDLARVQQVLRSGTIVFHFYRYWWQGFEADAAELRGQLAQFPDPDPTRMFRAEECTAVLLESGGQSFAAQDRPGRHSVELERKAASRKRLLRSRSFWDALVGLGQAQGPAYHSYSYARRADLYQLTLSAQDIARLAGEARRLARRELQAQLRRLAEATRIVFVCPRSSVNTRGRAADL